MLLKLIFLMSENADEMSSNDRRDFLKLAAGAVVGTAAIPLSQQHDSADLSSGMFEGFKSYKTQTTEVTINVISGAQGPPLLLLHGNPETDVTWHKIAPRLSTEFSVFRCRFRDDAV